MGYRNNSCGCFWEHFTWVCRFWGIVTAIGLWGIGAETAYHRNNLAAYLMVAALLMTFLETVFIINFCRIVCSRDGGSRGCGGLVWKAVIWVDNWKKGLLYLVLSVPAFIKPHEVWMAIISGVMIIICAVLYFIKTVKARQDLIAEERAKNQTYDRFDDIQDDLEDNVVENHNSLPIVRGETMAEQDEILEV